MRGVSDKTQIVWILPPKSSEQIKGGRGSFSVHLTSPKSEADANMSTALATSTLFIFVRCIYRTTEMAQGFEGPLSKNQITFMIFESVLIVLAGGVLLVFHPGFSEDFAKKRENHTKERSDSSAIEITDGAATGN